MEAQQTKKQSLVHAAAGDFVVEIAKYGSNQVIPALQQPSAYVCMVIEGTYVEDLNGGVIHYGPDTIVIRPARLRHSVTIGERGARVLLIEIPSPAAKRLSAHGMCLETLHVINRKVPAQMGRRLCHLSESSSSLGLESFVLEIFAELLRGVTETTVSSPGWMTRVLTFVEANFRRTISLEEIAAVAGIHPVHLSRSFRKSQGCTLGEFVRTLRVEEARRALVKTNLTITDIALGAGFADHSHLCRVFRAQTGMSPRQFRLHNYSAYIVPECSGVSASRTSSLLGK